MADFHSELIQEWRIPVWSSGFWALRFAGITGGLLQDMLAEGAATGLMSTWIYDFRPTPYDLGFDQPNDAIALLGTDAMRPWYPGESHYQSMRTRLREKWTFWTGDPKAGIVEELEAAGYAAPTISVPNDYASGSPDSDSHTDHWSRFWVEFAEGDHPITGPGTLVSDWLVGTTVLGPEGLTASYYQTLRSVVNRMKPVRWVVWDYRFILPGSERIDLQGHKRFADPDYVYYTT